MSWVTPQEVLNRFIDADKPDVTDAVLLTLIEDVEDAVLEIFPNLQSRIDAMAIPLARVKRVVSQVVIRSWKISQEYRASYSEASGPFSHGAGYGSGEAGKGIRLTDDEIKSLSDRKKAGIIMVSTAPNAHSHARPWAYVTGSGWQEWGDCD